MIAAVGAVFFEFVAAEWTFEFADTRAFVANATNFDFGDFIASDEVGGMVVEAMGEEDFHGASSLRWS